MPIRAAALLLAVACVATPLAAQQPQASAPAPTAQVRESARSTAQPGPRRQADYERFEPRLANERTTATTAAAADRTTITISTLALVVIVVLLVLLISN